MQVSQVNSNIPKVNNGRISRNINNKNQSFKGIGVAVDKFALGVANAIENGGLVLSFTLQDMLGTNIPRPVMGLLRNKKENKGKTNIRFAAKEFVREILTGPSMFIIPAIMLSVAKKFVGKTINVPMKVIKSLGDIHANQALNNAGGVINKQEFIQNAFATIIKNAKNEPNISETTIEKANELAKLLTEQVNKNGTKEAIKQISEEFINISKKYAKDAAHTNFTTVKLSDNTSVPVKDAINFITSYADDVVEKVRTSNTQNIEELIKNITNKKVISRFAMNTIMFAAVMTFLQVIPKLYNKAEGKENAGLKGLMKEETLNDSSLNDIKPKENKTSPSFGSAASFANKLTSSGLFGKIVQGAEFEGINVSFPLLLSVMGFGIILPRTVQAKDKYDREEILRRDVTTCAVMCFAEKALRKWFSKFNETKSGLVLAAKETGFKTQGLLKRLFDYSRPIKGVKLLSSDQIVSNYSGIDNYKDGIKGFCDFISEQGGDLRKVFSLTEESKLLVESVLQKEGASLSSANNNTITSILEKAKNSDEVKQLIKLFEDKNNPWVTKARTLNARFTALSVIVLVPVLLGFFLPWFNEKTTKRKFTEEHSVKNNDTNINNNFLIKNNSELFSDIANFTK